VTPVIGGQTRWWCDKVGGPTGRKRKKFRARVWVVSLSQCSKPRRLRAGGVLLPMMMGRLWPRKAHPDRADGPPSLSRVSRRKVRPGNQSIPAKAQLLTLLPGFPYDGQHAAVCSLPSTLFPFFLFLANHANGQSDKFGGVRALPQSRQTPLAMLLHLTSTAAQ
jgi:hypothetical protein